MSFCKQLALAALLVGAAGIAGAQAKVQITPGTIAVYAGGSGTCYGATDSFGDGCPAITSANLQNSQGLALSPSGTLYIVDYYNNRVRLVDGNLHMQTFAGAGGGCPGQTDAIGDGCPAALATLNGPSGIAFDASGNAYITEYGFVSNITPRIRMVSAANGIITTFAGTGVQGYSGDGGQATSATFEEPTSLAVDTTGNVYIVDLAASVVRMIDTNHKITTIVGGGSGCSGQTDSVGDGCPATSATLYDPYGITVDSTGNMYVADTNNNRIRRIDAGTGIITTVAGTGVQGFSGDNGPATAAELSYPEQVVVDAKGNLYITDSFNIRVRKVDTAGNITTVAGGGAGCTFTPCSALESTLTDGSGYPVGLTLDQAGNLYTGSGDLVQLVGPEGAVAFPATDLGQSSAPQTIVLSNLGTAPDTLPATLAGYALTGNTSEFALTGGTCLSNPAVAPGASCTLQAVFTPSAVSLRSAIVTYSDTALGSPHTITLYGTGAVAASQSITFPSIGSATYGDYYPILLSATASSGLPVTYSVVSGPATLSGYELTLTGAGPIVVQADQPGNAFYLPAASVQQTFTAAKATLTVVANQIQRSTTQLNPPALTYYIYGFVGNDTQLSATTGQPALVSNAPPNPPAGNYVITVSAGTLASQNYTFTFQNAFLDILPPSGTQTTLTLSTATATNQDMVTLTATVTTIGPLVPGNVTFSDSNGHILGHAAITGQYPVYAEPSTATISRRFPPGQYQILAKYDGTPLFTPSASAPQSLTVTGTQPTTTTLTVQPNAATPANSDLTASVLGLGAQPPSGSVTFNDVTASAVLGSIAPSGVGSGFKIQQFGSGTTASRIIVCDFDGDGIQDLITTDQQNLYISYGQGDGTYYSPVTFPVGTNLQSLAVADFNADGLLDVAVGDFAAGSITVISDGGEGGLQSYVTQLPAPSNPVALAVGDFNGDGVPDLAVAQNNGQNPVTVLISDGSGNFLYPQNYGSGAAKDISVGDFNGDGNLDIAISTGTNVSVLLGKGDGTFQPPVSSPVNGSAITSGDFNNDGKLDVALANGGAVVVALGNGDGTFQAPASYSVSTNAASIATADFNQDGHLDLVASDATSGARGTSVLLGAGNGTFQSPQTYNVGSGMGGLAVADLNGDYTPDLITIDSSSGEVSTLLGGIVSKATLANIDIVGAGPHTISSSYVPGSSSTYTGSVSNTVTINAQPVTISGISPQVIAAGANGALLAISGTNFSSGTIALVNGTPLSTTYVSPVQLTVAVPATLLGQPAILPIQLQTGSVLSNTISLTVVPDVSLTSLTPALTVAQSAATSITATGVNFTPTTVLQFNGTALPTTYVSATQINAVIPAASLTTAQTAQITAYDTASTSQSAGVPFVVLPSPAVIFTGPATSAAGTQPSLNFQISQPYPIAIAGTMTLTFQPSQGEPDDPSIQFSSGGRTLNFNLPANSATTPTVQLQSGTVAGTITVTLTLTANGVNVTPSSIAPVAISVPKTEPVITTQSIVRNANTVTIYVTGYSTSRDMANAYFNFTPISGAKFKESSFTVPVGPLFSAWFASTPSNQYGSTFTYFQTFTLDSKATDVESVSVTLENAQGKSQPEVVQ